VFSQIEPNGNVIINELDDVYLISKIYQNDTILDLKHPMNQIELKKEPFTLMFNTKEYRQDLKELHTTRIALLNKEVFEEISLLIFRDDRLSRYKIDCFSKGSALAKGYYGYYDEFYIRDNAHHAIIYGKDEFQQNARLISPDYLEDKQQNEFLYLGIKINRLMIRYLKKSLLINELPGDQIFLIIYNDFNLNNLIDKQEFKMIVVNFK
tara:strand:+ start:685 stop:1311 length:627 start_codon:yes stop_codon:yes gene_type:complete